VENVVSDTGHTGRRFIAFSCGFSPLQKSKATEAI
jgi:hypothetical protein